MTLSESIVYLTAMIGRGEKSPAEERRYRIELQALQDVYDGNPYNESRWNITEAYYYREAWDRALDQIRCQGKGVLPYDDNREESTHE